MKNHKEIDARTKSANKEQKLLDLSQCTPIECKATRRGRPTLRIVNTNKHGKRLNLSRTLIEKLDNPKSVQFLLYGEKIVLGSKLDADAPSHTFAEKPFGTIYNAQMVNAITDIFGLDFSSGKTSITLGKIKFKDAQNIKGKVVPTAIVSKGKA